MADAVIDSRRAGWAAP